MVWLTSGSSGCFSILPEMKLSHTMHLWLPSFGLTAMRTKAWHHFWVKGSCPILCRAYMGRNPQASYILLFLYFLQGSHFRGSLVSTSWQVQYFGVSPWPFTLRRFLKAKSYGAKLSTQLATMPLGFFRQINQIKVCWSLLTRKRLPSSYWRKYRIKKTTAKIKSTTCLSNHTFPPVLYLTANCSDTYPTHIHVKDKTNLIHWWTHDIWTY